MTNPRKGQGNRFLALSLAGCLAGALLAGRLLAAEGEAGVKIKILAINPSKTEAMNATVTHYLPAELKPEDILDASGMEVKHDKSKDAYYLTQVVPLKPRQTQTLTITVKDVWVVAEDEMTQVQQQFDQSIEKLQGTKYYETAKLLSERVTERIGTILEEQKNQDIGIRYRIERYRAHQKELQTIRSDMLSVDAMRRMQDEQARGVRTVKYVITATNPAAEAKQMTVRDELPKEITAEDVLDKKQFALLYDAGQRRFILESQEQFAPDEAKTYEVTLRDVWYIPQTELDLLRSQTEQLVERFRGTSYESYSATTSQIIYDTLGSITTLQEEVAGATDIKDRQRAFVLNKQRHEITRKKVKELQDLFLELPFKKTPDELKNLVLRLAELKKLIMMSIGYQPDRPVTWWFILAICAFLAVLSTVFYVVWLGKLKEYNARQKKAPATETKPLILESQPPQEGAPGSEPKQAAG